MQLPNENDCEMYLLGFFAASSRMRDRRTNASVPSDPKTNLPLSANDLTARTAAIEAEELALGMTVPLGAFDEVYTPGILARALLMRSDGELAGTHLSMIAPHLWDEEEAKAIRHLTFLFKRAAHKLGERGLVDLAPSGYEDAVGLPWDKTGLARACQVRGQGLLEARRRTRGTKYEKWSSSILDAVNDEVRRTAPEWAQAEWRQRSGFAR